MLDTRPTYDEVRDLLDYDPATGKFTWLKTVSSRAVALTEAGYVTPTRYRRIGIKGFHYLASHLAWLLMNGEWPDRQIYYKNYDHSDTRWDNLTTSKSEMMKLTPVDGSAEDEPPGQEYTFYVYLEGVKSTPLYTAESQDANTAFKLAREYVEIAIGGNPKLTSDMFEISSQFGVFNCQCLK